jgi:capsular polysaccharide export protein
LGAVVIGSLPPRLLESMALGVPSRGMARVATLENLIAPARLITGRIPCQRGQLAALLAWGRKPSARRAERLAVRRGLPLWRCEDGFLRSIGHGPNSPPLSLVVDDLGIYYDATAPSRLEQWIMEPLSDVERDRAVGLRQLWCQERVSKYNGSPESPAPSCPFVLVVDQTAGDLSIQHGQADSGSFQRMLAAARREFPNTKLVLKLHPEVVAGRKRGHFRLDHLRDINVEVCGDGGHPTALLEQAQAVFVVSSQLGFEALLWGKSVHCFGMPFYAGWGFTHDALPSPRRRAGQPACLGQLVHACLVRYQRSIDPHDHRSCAPEALIAAIGFQRRQRQRWPVRIEAFGFKPWKQPILRRFLSGSTLHFRRRNRDATRWADAVAIWGRDPGRGLARQRQAQSALTPLLRIEDGFLRSVGLGANLIEPVSWVVDQSGIYYDSTSSCDLETYLSTHAFSADELTRAADLRRQLVAACLTKYNLPAPAWKRPCGAGRVVLVPGQVEGDASIRFGAPGIRTNRSLLQAVRAREPDAWIVYKPHPDVVAGLRSTNAADGDLHRWCDEVLTHGDMDAIYSQVDALHVLTSLSGFEALLRCVEVHTWGLPFYAGWGLTQDCLRCERRGRNLSLDALVHATLIAYPTYVSRHSGLFISPEKAIEDLSDWRREPQRPMGWRRGIFRHWGRLSEWFAVNRRVIAGD